MAKDFCFTYYDGDAARDKGHMNRLERGAYDDIISAQRKRGRLSIDDIKKVLTSDFEACWPAMEWILKFEDDKYYIEWVEDSVQEKKKNAKKNSDRIKQYWADVEAGLIQPPKNGRKKYQTNTKEIPPYLTGITKQIPYEDEDEDEDINTKEGGMGETIPESPPIEKTPEYGLREAVIPCLQSSWYSVMTHQTKRDETDFWALGKIWEFMQHQFRYEWPRDRGKAEALMKKIAVNANQSDFWRGKPLQTIEKHLQTFLPANGAATEIRKRADETTDRLLARARKVAVTKP